MFYPVPQVTRKVRKTDRIFTIGSCFAREAEQALQRAGYNAISVRNMPDFPNTVSSGYVNRYNTYSILNELRWAAGEEFPKNGYLQLPNGKYVDLHSHPILPSLPREEITQYRKAITSYFSKIFEAEVVTVTLGLIEGWYDKEQENYINFAPVFGESGADKRQILKEGRFEFRVISYEENMQNLREISQLISASNPNANIIATVSPVALSATFTKRDVVVANCLSKSMLRTCAESWLRENPGLIQYFPSYEMTTLSPRELAITEDGMHVKREFVESIMDHFLESFVETD